MVTPWSTADEHRSRNHLVRITTLIKNVTDNFEKQKCHDDFQTKRNENPATPEIGQCLQRTTRWSWSVTTFHGHVEKSTLVQRTRIVEHGMQTQQ
ncbi:hypothetical protein C0J52_23666 [Blattella germanica]|nr:hypothetical protein C0J52_23666 [Blattella germanica]